MKKLFTLIIMCICFNLNGSRDEEKIPLLKKNHQSKKTNNKKKKNNTKNVFLSQAIEKLKDEGYGLKARILQRDIKNSKNTAEIKKVVQENIDRMESEVNNFKQNHSVVIDHDGNLVKNTNHKLGPIIDLLKSYLKRLK